MGSHRCSILRFTSGSEDTLVEHTFRQFAGTSAMVERCKRPEDGGVWLPDRPLLARKRRRAASNGREIKRKCA